MSWRRCLLHTEVTVLDISSIYTIAQRILHLGNPSLDWPCAPGTSTIGLRIRPLPSNTHLRRTLPVWHTSACATDLGSRVCQFKLEWNHWRIRYSAGPRNQPHLLGPSSVNVSDLTSCKASKWRIAPKTVLNKPPSRGCRIAELRRNIVPGGYAIAPQSLASCIRFYREGSTVP